MNSVSTWLTEDQVMETLDKLSGRRGRGRNVGNVYFLKGNEPPPVMTEAEDEEMQLQFGDAIREGKDDIPSENAPPDLQGITDLLRMVHGSDSEEDKGDISSIGQPSNYFITISKGNQLNPDVKEFIPRGANSSHSSSDVSVNILKTVEKTDDTATDVKMDPATEELATTLKNKISDAAKSKSFELKKQKNVAIATLLRLYASNNKPTSPKPSENLKLITPDYYENQSDQKNVQPEVTIAEVGTPPSVSTSPNPKSLTPTTQVSSGNDVKSEPTLSTRVNKKSPKPKVDPAIKTSIEKVNQWFGEPAERKSPAICIGPIPFKKKDPAATKPTSTLATNGHVSNPVQCNEYKPSTYAADLERKYMERNKAKKDEQKKNLWTDLHVVLKEKDELKKKQLQKGLNSDVDEVRV